MAANWDNRLGGDPEFNLILYILFHWNVHGKLSTSFSRRLIHIYCVNCEKCIARVLPYRSHDIPTILSYHLFANLRCWSFFFRLFSNQYHQFATKKGQNWVKYGHFNLAQNMTSFTRILTIFVVVAGIITLICYQKKVHQKTSIMLRSNSYSKTSMRIRVLRCCGLRCSVYVY